MFDCDGRVHRGADAVVPVQNPEAGGVTTRG